MRCQILAACLVTSVAAAQSESPVVDAPAWHIPIHTGEADPVGGEYGTWAAGPDYKVSFHDGVAYYPVLGESYPHNLPLTWRTESVTAGGETWIDGNTPATESHSEWRYEIRRGGVIEAYDVRRDGVEQTFTLLERPPVAGDLVVTGRIETDLRATDTAPRHGPLTFRDDDGNPIVEYGAAIAFDAAGDTLPMQTALAGDRIRLTVDATWLRDAVYPVTLDPLLSSFSINTGGTGVVDVVGAGNGTFVRVESRAVSATDYDLHGAYGALSQATAIYADISPLWSTEYAQISFVGGATFNPSNTKYGRYVIAMQRDTPIQSLLRAYVHNHQDFALNSGQTHILTTSPGIDHKHPSVGGTDRLSRSGSLAVIVYESGPIGGAPALEAVTLDASFGSTGFGTPVEVAPNTTGFFSQSNTWPCITRTSDGGTGSWVVVWQQLPPFLTSWEVKAARIQWDGQVTGTLDLGGSTANETHPKVAGRQGRFLAAWEHGGNEIRIQRFDWPDTGAATAATPKTLATAGALVTGEGRPIAYDDDTMSHWVIAYQRWDPPGTFWGKIGVDRVGYSGGVLESTLAYPGHQTAGGYHPSACYEDVHGDFPVLWATADGYTHSREMVHDPAARNTRYGASCTGMIAGFNGNTFHPYAGSEFVTVQLIVGRANALSALFLSGTQASVQLPSGCWTHLGQFFSAGGGASDSQGNITGGPFTLPDDPVVIGDLFWQWFQVDPATNGLVSSEGLQMSIR